MDLTTTSGVADGVAAQRAGTIVPILANPYSGRGANRQRVQEVIDSLSDHGLEPMPIWELDERAMRLGDADFLANCRALISAGGDGSLGDVVNDLYQAHGQLDVPIAVLPLGNENLFARQFGFDCSVTELARSAAAGQVRQVDIGKAGDRLFTLMASAGFDADVVHRMARWRGAAGPLRRVSSLDYVPKIMRAAAGYGYTRMTVEVDGQAYQGSHLFVFNLPQYGGGLGIAPKASGSDAQLDWVMFERPGLVNLADYAWTVLRAKHLGRPDVPHGRATTLRVTSEMPVPMQADGDPAGFTPIQVSVMPKAMATLKIERARNR